MAKQNRYANLAASQFEVNGRTRRSNDPEWHRFLAEAERRNNECSLLEILANYRRMKRHQRSQYCLQGMSIKPCDSACNTRGIA